MNKDNAKDYLPLVQALADGKTIQCKNYSDVGWIDLESVRFDSYVESYRIKPEPKKGWYRVALLQDEHGFTTYSCEDDDNGDDIDSLTQNMCMDFVRWLTDRIEYTIPEGEA